MKKIFNKSILLIIISFIIFGGSIVYAAFSYTSRDITFSPEDEHWNVNRVDDALNDLYRKNGRCSTIINQSWKFGYTGEGVTFVPPCAGNYKLEVWGAQGGSSSYIGGRGGYSVGEIELDRLEKVYVYVGGQGSCTSSATTINGGYNGGGIARNKNVSYVCSGGGATHIAKRDGLLSDLGDYKGTLSEDGKYYISRDIIIVAGGGSGSYLYGSYSGQREGSSGGGMMGAYPNSVSYTGTQTSGANFGAGNLTVPYPNDNQSGGGGGFFGGSTIWGEGGPGGGSGYIANPDLKNKKMIMYGTNNRYVSSDSNTYTEITTNESSSPVSNYSKTGHGYAKITYLG